jgi:hypothetical protein
MKEPKRLSLESDSELERVLLRAGRALAQPVARQRALAAASAVLGSLLALGPRRPAPRPKRRATVPPEDEG